MAYWPRAHSCPPCMLIAACAAALFLFSACGAPAIDATSDHSMHESILHARSQLPPAQREEFDRALRDLDDMLFRGGDALSGASISNVRPEALRRTILHNKTAREVVLMVEAHRGPKK